MKANSNTAAELIVAPFFSIMSGIWVATYFGSIADTMILKSQANFNNVALAGAGRLHFNQSGINFGIILESEGSIIDHSQANHNTIGDEQPQPHTAAAGILIDEASPNITVSDTSADSNTGGIEAIGIILNKGFGRTLLNTNARSNGNYGVQIGYFDDLGETQTGITIIGGIFNNNGSAVGPASGINIQPLTGGTSKVEIKGVEIYDNGSALSTSAAGIDASNASNVVIEDTNVFNTISSTTAHGILFNNVTDSKIIRTQVHGSQNAGVELIGSNDTISIIESTAKGNDIGFEFAAGSTAVCCLVQDSRALSNKTAGFVHATTPLTTTFIGNEAQCNGTKAEDNYVIADPQHNAINLQELAWHDGSLITISPRLDNRAGKRHKKDSCKGGGAACGARFTNLRAVREHAKNPCR